MNLRKIIFLTSVLVSCNLACVFPQPSLSPKEKTKTYLDKFRIDYSSGMMNKDPGIISAYYANNIRLMPEFQKTIMGKSNAELYHKAFLSRFDIKKYSRDKIEILDLGTRVVELGSFTMNITLKSTNQQYELKGKYQNIWEKSGDGKLSLITEAWNYSHQVDIYEQLRFAEVPSVNIALEPHLPINSNISFELAALNRLLEVTITQHDAKTWSRFYTDDAMYIYSANPIYEGRKAVDEFLEKHTSGLPIFEKLDIRNDRIDDLGDFVIEYASHVANWKNGESSGVNTGKDIRIWKRGADCSLKIFRSMAMYD
jgi:ketosteroid isomerase-like protein